MRASILQRTETLNSDDTSSLEKETIALKIENFTAEKMKK